VNEAAATAPNFTAVAPVKPSPLTMTFVAPPSGPSAGSIEATLTSFAPTSGLGSGFGCGLGAARQPSRNPREWSRLPGFGGVAVGFA